MKNVNRDGVEVRESCAREGERRNIEGRDEQRDREKHEQIENSR